MDIKDAAEKNQMINIELSPEAGAVLDELNAAGHEAYIVGGCVRDSLLGRKPKDWDICTDATPQQMKKCLSFSTVDTGIKHGTLTVLVPEGGGEQKTGAENEKQHSGTRLPFEVTTYRIDGDYKDHRRPESVEFTVDIRGDLARRDFTVNAMAWNGEEGLMDPYGGRNDLHAKVIRCVGDPEKRFEEDALRIMRAVRFASQLDMKIEPETAAAMERKKALLHDISAERIRDELVKTLCGQGVVAAADSGREILAEIVPEIRPMFDLDQETRYHIYDVWKHTLHAVENVCRGIDEDHAAEANAETDAERIEAGAETQTEHGAEIRTGNDAEAVTDIETEKRIMAVAAFLHDIGKPDNKSVDENGNGHFYKHEVLSAAITAEVMRRLKFDNLTSRTVIRLVRDHSIVFAPGTAQARRMLHKMGPEDLFRLIRLETADIKSQSPECIGVRLENVAGFRNDVRRAIADEQCFAMKDMAVDGRDLIDAGVPQGKDIGRILKQLLQEVVDGDLENDKAVLMDRAEKIR